MSQVKNILKAFFGAGICFGTIMGGFYAIMSFSLIYGILLGIFSGIVFGLFIAIFIFFLDRNSKKKYKGVIDGKKIIFYGAANHFKGKESVGGYLYLTKKEIIFKSHKLNIQVHEEVIPIEQISEVNIALTYGLVPNGLYITTLTSVEKFVVFNRKKWLSEINDVITSQHKESEVGFN